MTNVAKIIGIDISKEKFDVCFSSKNDSCTSCSYVYNKNGIKSFLKNVPHNSICIMEATGIYHLKLAYALYEQNIFVAVVNPLSAKNFSRATQAFPHIREVFAFPRTQAGSYPAKDRFFPWVKIA